MAQFFCQFIKINIYEQEKVCFAGVGGVIHRRGCADKV
jgi:hypothetical protein